MAFTLELVRRGDFTTDVSVLDLTAYTDGLNLAKNGYLRGDNLERYKYQDVLTLRATGSDTDDLASVLSSLGDKIRETWEYIDEQEERYSVWLRAKLDGETYERQAFLYDLKLKLITSPHAQVVGRVDFIPELTLGVVRGPWEITNKVIISGAAVSSVGGLDDYTSGFGEPGPIVGDIYPRVAQFEFRGSSGGGGPLYEFWAGFRSDRFGNRANFQPVWNLDLASSFGADTTGGTSHADATAKNGYKAVCTFTTNKAMARRLAIKTADVTANWIDQRGLFVVLLRAKITSAGTVLVQLSDGAFASIATRFDARGPVAVDKTSWFLYEMGEVSLPNPPRLLSSSDSLLEYYAMALDAQQVTASVSLELDCLVLIPKREGFIYSDGGVVEYVGGDYRSLRVGTTPEGLQQAIAFSGGSPQYIGDPKTDGVMPLGSGIIVGAAQRSAQSVLTDVWNYNGQIVNRWAELRGAAVNV